MQIPMDEGLRIGQKLLPHACDRDLEWPVAAQVGDDSVELRRSVAVAIADAVGIAKMRSTVMRVSAVFAATARCLPSCARMASRSRTRRKDAR